MAKYEPKTRKTKASVKEFIASLPTEKIEGTKAVLAMMKKSTGEPPAMWGPNIIGFGTCLLVYASGQKLDWPIIGFSPRQTSLTLYILPPFSGYEDLLSKLGKHTIGKTCLYIKRLSDVDLKVLQKIIDRSVANTKKQYEVI